MSEHDLEKIRALYAAWAEGDFSAGAELYHPDVDFVIGPDFPDSGHYRGLEGINRYMRLLLEPWDRLTIAAEEIEEVGQSVMVAVLQAGTGSGSGIATEFHYFHLWTFVEGQVVHWENFRDRASALAAAAAAST